MNLHQVWNVAYGQRLFTNMLALPQHQSKNVLTKQQRMLLVFYQCPITDMWLLVRCLAALAPKPEVPLFETDAFRFLLFQTFISYRRAAAQSWYESNRPSVPSTSRTIYCDADNGNDTTGDGSQGNPYKTLGKLVTVQQGGSHSDTYYLKGTFDEQKLVALVGGTPGPSNWLVFKKWPGSSALLKGTSDGYHPFTLASSNGYVWIEGLTFESRTGVSVQMLGATGPLVMIDCTHTNSNVLFSRANGSWIESQTFLRTDSYVSNAGDTITIVTDTTQGSDDVVIYDCDISHNGHMGISITPSGAPVQVCDNLRIGFCRVSNRWSGGIALGFITNSIVECCDLYEMARDDISGVGTKNALIIEGEDTIARYNRIWDTQAQAILIQGNVFGGQEQTALRCNIYHNSIVGNYGPAVQFVVRFVSHVEDNIFQNNLCWNNCLGGMTTTSENQGYFNFHLYDFWINIWNADSTIVDEWIPVDSSVAANRTMNGNKILTNFCSTTSTYALVYVALSGDGGTTNYTDAQAETQFGTTYFDGQLYSDPLLASTDDTSDEFLYITEASPARDAARAIVGVDYSGAAADIGFHEYVAIGSNTSLTSSLVNYKRDPDYNGPVIVPRTRWH